MYDVNFDYEAIRAFQKMVNEFFSNRSSKKAKRKLKPVAVK